MTAVAQGAAIYCESRDWSHEATEKKSSRISRKIGKKINLKESQELCDKYSELVVDKVVNSPWVPGVEEYIKTNPFDQKFVIVTGTPKEEIDIVLDRLKIIDSFSSIYGAPKEKKDIVKYEINVNQHYPAECIFIGDSSTDLHAARSNKIEFISRGNEKLVNNMKKQNFIENFLDIPITYVQ